MSILLLRFAKRFNETASQRKSKLRCQSFDFGHKKRPHRLYHMFDRITSEERTMLLFDRLGN